MFPATDLTEWLPGLEASAMLGTRFVLAPYMDPVETRAIERYGQLCAVAGAFGLNVAMEFLSWSPMRTLRDALRVLDQVAAPNAGPVIDFLHLARTGGTPSDFARVPAHKIAYAQICAAAASLAPGADLADEARTRAAIRAKARYRWRKFLPRCQPAPP